MAVNPATLIRTIQRFSGVQPTGRWNLEAEARFTEALKVIQAELGIEHDGIVGPQTMIAFTRAMREGRLNENFGNAVIALYKENGFPHHYYKQGGMDIAQVIPDDKGHHMVEGGRHLYDLDVLMPQGGAKAAARMGAPAPEGDEDNNQGIKAPAAGPVFERAANAKKTARSVPPKTAFAGASTALTISTSPTPFRFSPDSNGAMLAGTLEGGNETRYVASSLRNLRNPTLADAAAWYRLADSKDGQADLNTSGIDSTKQYDTSKPKDIRALMEELSKCVNGQQPSVEAVDLIGRTVDETAPALPPPGPQQPQPGLRL